MSSGLISDLSIAMESNPPGELSDQEAAGFLAQVLLEMYRSGKRNAFEQIFGIVEHYVIYGEPEEQQLVIVGFLESLKNYSCIVDLDYAVFEEWLGAESHVAWRWLEKKWQGKQSLASTVRDTENKQE